MDRIRRLENENIIIITNNLLVTEDVVEANRAEVRRLIQDMDGPVAIVIDFREAQTNFADIIKLIKGNQAGKRADLNQRAFTIMVGDDKLIAMYLNSMGQEKSGSVQVPYFSSMDKALEAARAYLKSGSRLEPA